MIPATGDWVRDARQVIKDAPRDFYLIQPHRYWIDFLTCVTCAYVSATFFLSTNFAEQLWIKIVAFPFTVFWLYRSSSMVHEVCHLHEKQLVGFKVAWNLLLGVPTLFPSTFFTMHHRDHHSGRHYGTPQDPEYAMNYFDPNST